MEQNDNATPGDVNPEELPAEEPLERKRKVPVRTKLLFASGSIQEAAITAGGIVTILFYNQVLGVSASLCGTAFLIASIIDAISDPLIGTWSDRFQSKWGRRHPFMLASGLPIALAFYLLYQPVSGLSEMGYFTWLTVFLVALRIGQTFYLIPHDALGAELTDDYKERSSIFGYNSVAQTIMAIVAVGILYVLIFPTTPDYENGLLNEARYIILAVAGSTTIIFSTLLVTFGTLDQLPYLHKVEISKKFDLKGYFSEIGTLLRNRSYLAACFSLLTTYAGLGIIGVVATYAYIYVFGLSSEEMTIAGFAKLPGVLTALPLLAFLSRFMEKKQMLILATAITAVLVSLPYHLKMIGWFPANDSALLLPALFVPLLVAFMVFPIAAIVIDSQLVDVADEHEYLTGKRSEGIIFSVRSFGIKATQGVGGFVAGFGLEMIGFPENAESATLSAETINGLLILNGPLYLGLYVIAIGFMMMYRIDEPYHRKILKELEARRDGVQHDQ